MSQKDKWKPEDWQTGRQIGRVAIETCKHRIIPYALMRLLQLAKQMYVARRQTDLQLQS